MRNLCEVLTDSVQNCLMDEEHTLLADMINHPDENAEKIRNLQPDFEIWKKHFYKSKKAIYKQGEVELQKHIRYRKGYHQTKML